MSDGSSTCLRFPLFSCFGLINVSIIHLPPACCIFIFSNISISVSLVFFSGFVHGMSSFSYPACCLSFRTACFTQRPILYNALSSSLETSTFCRVFMLIGLLQLPVHDSIGINVCNSRNVKGGYARCISCIQHSMCRKRRQMK